MVNSGLIDVQSHSKTHRNLIERLAGEDDARYRNNIDAEMRVPRELLERRLAQTQVRHIAYPFGDANETVLDSAARHRFELGLTVIPGGNAFFAQPLMLRRTMVFGDLDLEGFKSKLQVARPIAAP
jgi:peptidoglycan/xylan/chitin deacetylase (PgdA/CDA1 family)